MRAHELIQERSDARTEIENMATILPGSPDEYFVRFTDQDKVGFSARQHFGRTPDVDDPGFDPMALPRPQGRPALWFYPLRTYLKNKDLFASQHPYTWLVRLKPTAWLQRVGREDKTESVQCFIERTWPFHINDNRSLFVYYINVQKKF